MKFFKHGPSDVVAHVLTFLESDEKVDERASLGRALIHKEGPRGERKPVLTSAQLIQAKRGVTGLSYKDFQELMRDFGADFTSKNLIQFNLSGSKPTDLELELMTTGYNNEGAAVPRFPNMSRLDLSNSKSFSNGGLACLKNTPHLKSLSLSGCTQITAEGFAHLENLSELESLDLRGCNVTDEILAQIIAWCPNLKKLNLFECKGFSNAGLESVSQLAHLEELNVSHTPVTDAGLAHLRDNQTLRRLYIAGCEITDVGVDHIATIMVLTELNLRACRAITTISPISQKLRKLEALNLANCLRIANFDDLGRLSSLRSLSAADCWNIRASLPRITPYLGKLQTLNLSNCRVEDSDCSSFRNLKSLRSLTLSGFTTQRRREENNGVWGNPIHGQVYIGGITDAVFDRLSSLSQLTEVTVEDYDRQPSRSTAFEKIKSLQTLKFNQSVATRKEKESHERGEQAAREQQNSVPRRIWNELGMLKAGIGYQLRKHKAEIAAAACAVIAAVGWRISQAV